MIVEITWKKVRYHAKWMAVVVFWGLFFLMMNDPYMGTGIIFSAENPLLWPIPLTILIYGVWKDKMLFEEGLFLWGTLAAFVFIAEILIPYFCWVFKL